MEPPGIVLPGALQGAYAHLITHPSYYFFYGLYADYVRNNAWFSLRERAQRIGRMLHTVRPLMALEPAFRKSLPMRLFSRRERLKLGHPRDVSVAWRGLQQLVATLGTPEFAQPIRERTNNPHPARQGLIAPRVHVLHCALPLHTHQPLRKAHALSPFCYRLLA